MKDSILSLILLLLASTRATEDREQTSTTTKRPNIIFILADDLGWNDVSFHGSNQIPTPNIDALAYSGIILHNYYADPICTPSRSALMTGYHPIHTGMQSHTLAGSSPYGLPLQFKMMPEYLNDLGYQSVMVGKWHLGNHRAAYTPTKRGFSSHVGYWTGHEDYYDHTAEELRYPVNGWGYDFRRNMSIAREYFGKYATDIFTEEAVSIINSHQKEQPLFLYLSHLAVHSANEYNPIQAPKEAVEKFSYITDPHRRNFAGVLHKLDESVGKVVKALVDANMLHDSIIVFSSDNGGPAAGFNINAASNFPLKGVKDTLWEGGTRAAGFVWSPLLKSAPRVSSEMMNIQDWLPTLYTAAGGKSKISGIDGMDMWDSLSQATESPRKLFLHNIDGSRGIQGLRLGEWKLTKGTTYNGGWDGHYGPGGRDGDYAVASIRDSPVAQSLNKIGMPLGDDQSLLSMRSQSTVNCPRQVADAKPCRTTCLFNITADPCELNDVTSEHPDVVKLMEHTLDLYKKSEVPRLNKPLELRANPKFFDYTWTNWLDFYEPLEENQTPPEEVIAMQGERLEINDLMIQELLSL